MTIGATGEPPPLVTDVKAHGCRLSDGEGHPLLRTARGPSLDHWSNWGEPPQLVTDVTAHAAGSLTEKAIRCPERREAPSLDHWSNWGEPPQLVTSHSSLVTDTIRARMPVQPGPPRPDLWRAAQRAVVDADAPALERLLGEHAALFADTSPPPVLAERASALVHERRCARHHCQGARFRELGCGGGAGRGPTGPGLDGGALRGRGRRAD